jgi:potassium efflux system protein
MESSSSAGQALLDVWLSSVKLLARPAVQRQVLIALIVIVAAWLISRWITTRMQRRYAVRAQAVRDAIVADAQAALDATDDDDTELHAHYLALIENDATITKAVDKQLGARRAAHLILAQIIYPVLALIGLYASYVAFVARQWYGGLLAELTILFMVYALYRLALGVAFALGNPQRIAYYQHRLFGPLVIVAVVIFILDTVADVSLLAEAQFMPLQDGWLTIGSVFTATFGYYVWIMVISLVKDIALTYAGRQGRVNTGSLDAGLTLIQYSLVAVGLFGVFRLLQFNAATVAAITGGLSIGVGIALQDVLKNFLGGIIVLFEGSVRPGDWIEVSGTEGEIASLSIRSTVVRTFDNVEYIVPNQDWLNSTVKTFTRGSRRGRARIPIGVSYNADPHMVQQLLIDTAKAHPDVLAEPPPVAPLVDFGASSVDFLLLAWVEDAKTRGKVSGELRLRIWDALAAAGIEIPFPQQDIHIRSGLPTPVTPTASTPQEEQG